MFPEDVAQVLDGGRAFNAGIRREVSFMARMFPIRSATHRRRRSSAPSRKPGSKISFASQPRRGRSGNSEGALDSRADPQNLPPGLLKESGRRPLTPHSHRDYGSAYKERAEIYTSCATQRSPASRSFPVTATASGGLRDLGTAARQVRSVGLSFVGASLSSADPWKPTSTICPGPIRCARLFLAIGRTARSPTGPTTCC